MRFELEDRFFRQDDQDDRIYRSAFALCSHCPGVQFRFIRGSYLPKIPQGFEDAFDLPSALGAFAAELGGEGFGGGGGVGGDKLPDKSDLFG